MTGALPIFNLVPAVCLTYLSMGVSRKNKKHYDTTDHRLMMSPYPRDQEKSDFLKKSTDFDPELAIYLASGMRKMFDFSKLCLEFYFY